VWASDILSRLQDGRLQHIDVEDLQLYAPNLLFDLIQKQAETLSRNQLQSRLNDLQLKK